MMNGGQVLSAAWRNKSRVWSEIQQPAYLPLKGILVGALAGAVFMAADNLLKDKALAVLLSLTAGIISTKAAGERGWAHFFESFAGSATGLLSSMVSLLIRYHSLLLLPARLIPSVLIAGHAFSRYASGSFLFTHSRLTWDGHGYQRTPQQQPLDVRNFIVLTFLGMAPLLIIGNLTLLLLIPLLWLSRNIFSMWFIRKLGGYTQDCLGATQVFTETLFYLLAAFACLHPIIVG
jgi:adenosylcobinamide-GDP ribazoletransferase